MTMTSERPAAAAAPIRQAQVEATVKSIFFDSDGILIIKFTAPTLEARRVVNFILFSEQQAALGLEYRQSDDPEKPGYETWVQVKVGVCTFWGLAFDRHASSTLTLRSLANEKTTEQFRNQIINLQNKNVLVHFVQRINDMKKPETDED